jgi:diguanylate cyclase (GGDEF)-like protein
MWNRTPSRSTTIRTAAVVSSMLLSCAAIAANASAQTLTLSTAGLLPTGGVEVTTGPEGVKLGVDAGDTGGVNAGAGPGGVDLDLRVTPRAPAVPGAGPPDDRASTPAAPAAGAPPAGAPTATAPRAPAVRAPAAATPRTGEDGSAAGGGGGRGEDGARRSARSDGPGRADRSRSGSPAVVDRLRAARTDREDRGGVAPVFDLIDRIPSTVRAALVALGLIAFALWALWVHGRRRLQHNAYLDPVTGVANMVAFEQVLDREWQRAMRYRRPLGLLLLDLEERGAATRRVLGERDAQAAVEGIGCEVRESDTVARLASSRFAVICPEAPQGSIETLGRALEHRLEERRLRSWAGVAERDNADAGPGDIVTRAAAALAHVHGQAALGEVAPPEPAADAVPAQAGRRAAAA